MTLDHGAIQIVDDDDNDVSNNDDDDDDDDDEAVSNTNAASCPNREEEWATLKTSMKSCEN